MNNSQRFLLAPLVRFFALGTVAASLITWLQAPAMKSLDFIAWNQQALTFLVYVLPILALCAMRPAIGGAAGVMLGIWYLQYHQTFPTALLALLYLVGLYGASFLLSRVVIARFFRSLLQVRPEFSGFLPSIVFLSLAPLLSGMLLALHLHTISAVFSLLLMVLSLAAVIFYRSDARTVFFPEESPALRELSADFARLCVALLVGIAAILLLYPESLAGDSEKAYLAYPKYFALSNSIVITDPAWLRNVMAGYHHTQEIFLSTGYLLSGDTGIKLFALLFVILKCQLFLLIGRSLLGLSPTLSLLALASYLLFPLTFEMHAIVRPENSLTVALLSLFYLFELLRDVRRRNWSQEFFALLCMSALCAGLAVSIKLTALYFLPACALVFWREALFAFKNLRQLRLAHYCLLSVSVLIGASWFIRNFLQFGFLINMSPFEKYHLTVWFPPIRTLSEAWTFLREGMIRADRYTEFGGQLGYGFLGFVLLPATIWTLGKNGRVQRLALVSLLYGAMLLFCTRQIRYLAPVVPGFALCLFALRVPSFRLEQWMRRNAATLCYLIIATQTLVSYQVLTSSGIIPALRRRFVGMATHPDDAPSYIAPLNKVLSPEDSVLTPYFDMNYFLKAKPFRGDPIDSWSTLSSLQKEHHFSHWLIPPYAIEPRNYFFNDKTFIEALSDPLVTSRADWDPNWHIQIFQPNRRLLRAMDQLVRDRGWDPKKTLIVSGKRKLDAQSMYVLGERVSLPGSGEDFYRVRGAFLDDGTAFYDFGSTPNGGSSFRPIAWYSDIGSAQIRPESFAVKKSEVNLSPLPFGRQDSSPRFRTVRYQFHVPESAGDRILLEVYGKKELFLSVKNGDLHHQLKAAAIQGFAGEATAGVVELLPGSDAIVEVGEPSSINYEGIRMVLIAGKIPSTGQAIAPPIGGDKGPRLVSMVDDFSGKLESSEGLSARVVSHPSARARKSDSAFEVVQRRYRISLPVSFRRNIKFRAVTESLTLKQGEQLWIRVISPNSEQQPEVLTSIVGPVTAKAFLLGEKLFETLLSDRHSSRYEFEVSLDLRRRAENTAPRLRNLRFEALRNDEESLRDLTYEAFLSRESAYVAPFMLSLQDSFLPQQGVKANIGIERSSESCLIDSLIGVGNVIHPEEVGKTASLHYVLPISQTLARNALQLLVAVDGRTYSSQDKLALGVSVGGKEVMRKAITLSSSPGTPQQLSLELPAQSEGQMVELRFDMTSAVFADRVFLKEVRALLKVKR